MSSHPTLGFFSGRAPTYSVLMRECGRHALGNVMLHMSECAAKRNVPAAGTAALWSAPRRKTNGIEADRLRHLKSDRSPDGFEDSKPIPMPIFRIFATYLGHTSVLLPGTDRTA